MPRRRLRPALLLSVTTTVLLIAAAVHASGTHWKETVARLTAEGRAARAKAHLPCPWAGSPEMFFKSSGLVLSPGKAVTLRATGHFPKRVNVVFHDDDVHVTHSHVSATQLTAQVQASPKLLPGTVDYELISPACERTFRPYPPAEVRAGLEWDLHFTNGWKLHLRMPPKGMGEANWSRTDHQKKMSARSSAGANRTFTITLAATPQEQMAQMQDLLKAQAAFRKTHEYEVYAKEMGSAPHCDFSKPGCSARFRTWNTQLQAAAKAAAKKRVALFPKAGPRGFGCNGLEATVDEALQVKVHATECGEAGELDGTGTVRID